MAIPEGYVVLDFVGFTDKGEYSETTTYMKNDLVHFDNTVWRCLVDNTSSMEPSETAAAWGIFVEGEKPYYGAYADFPNPGEPNKFYVDDTADPRLMYTWDETTEKYILTGGAGGADGGSVDIPITLNADDWTGATAPYAQTVTVPQMREGMTPLYFLGGSGDDIQYAFSLITGFQSGYAQITFYAADTPEVDIPIILKGIPAQEMEYVDNTVAFLVEPSGFTKNTTTGRYESTIEVPGMTEGTGGVWDIIRSGPVLTEVESAIAAAITDVDRLDGAVKISCFEVPAQRYMMCISGAYPDVEPGTVILAGMQEWFDRVDALEKSNEYSFEEKVIGSWLDGKPLYRKMINFGELPVNSEKEITHNIENIKHSHINIGESFWFDSNSGYSGACNSFVFSNYIELISTATRNRIIIKTNNANASAFSAIVCLEYTKTTD